MFDIYCIDKIKKSLTMNTFYDDVFEYGDEIALKEKNYYNGGSASGRSQQQIEIDNEQSSEISANTKSIQDEIKRSTGIDESQSADIKKNSDSITVITNSIEWKDA